ncbi:transcription factor [Castilleja foliolosa]|uniref:Transcription factor n=1 Tax=Castilleja foliolosa TaxID=1961234 RepID=A0ABD3EP50_9LAMI
MTEGAAATEGDAENIVTDYVLKVLGLDVCADTLVGDEDIRGISGGQKKPVTTGEMIVGPQRHFSWTRYQRDSIAPPLTK